MKPNKSGPFIIMKTLKNSAFDFTNLISKSIKEMRDSYITEINYIKLDLLKRLSEDYGIPFEELANKYIKKNKTNINKQDDEFNPSIAIDTYEDNSDLFSEELLRLTDVISDEFGQEPDNIFRYKVEPHLLHKVIIENNVYYVENKENGDIYDIESNIVGKYINGALELNTMLARKYRIEMKNKKYGIHVQKFLMDYEEKIKINKEFRIDQIITVT